MTIQSINPATEDVIETFQTLSNSEIEAALSKAENAFYKFRKSDIGLRSRNMSEAANILESDKDRWARIITEEMGKTLTAAKAEVEKCALACRYYAEHTEEILADSTLPGEDRNNYIRYLPLGPVLAVMPWNFPFWQVFRFAAPALMAGNVGLLKHASNVPGSALAISEIFKAAGFDEGVFQTLLIKSDVIEKIISDPRVKAATLTGSEGAGAAVASLSGKYLKKTVLELGGSDPFIVMPSADMETTLDAAVTARTMNCGQSCIAAKRFIVHEDIYDKFEEGFRNRIASLRIGDPMADDTQVGPLATPQIRDDVHKQVQRSVALGAEIVTGAECIDGPGYFYKPGILRNIPKNSPAYSEEVFGPVALMFKAGNIDDAIKLANATRYGLGSSIWSREQSDIDFAIENIEAGSTFVNAIVASDPKLPFGGIKSSGYGRELSYLGMREFINMKTVSIA